MIRYYTQVGDGRTPRGRHFIRAEAQDLLWLFSSKASRGVTQSHQAVPYLARDQTLRSVL